MKFLRLPTLLIIALSWACTSDEAQPCGAGDTVEASGQTVCVYREEIIETGFDCPAQRPHRHEVDELIVCSPNEDLPEGLPEKLDERYPDDEYQPDGGESGWDVDTSSPECREDADCSESEACIQQECRDTSGLRACQAYWECRRGELCEDGYCFEDPNYPPDTDAARFEGTACYQEYAERARADARCRENVGCAELDIRCGQCVCTLCADQYCLRTVCDDGGPGCGNGGWDAGSSSDGG